MKRSLEISSKDKDGLFIKDIVPLALLNKRSELNKRDDMLKGLKTTKEEPRDIAPTNIPPKKIPGFLQVPSSKSKVHM